jgi:hypothetical protein
MTDARGDIGEAEDAEKRSRDTADSANNDQAYEEREIFNGVGVCPEKAPHQLALIGNAEVAHRSPGRQMAKSNTEEPEEKHHRDEYETHDTPERNSHCAWVTMTSPV